MLVKLVMCTGAASTHDAPSLGQDIKVLREALFMQVLSSAYLVYTQVRLKTSQILLLVVSSYCFECVFSQANLSSRRCTVRK